VIYQQSLRLLLLPLLLASCGDLPEPFLGNPGAAGRTLAQPPTPRLAVSPPANALLPDAATREFASELAAGLQTREVPAVADQVRKNDWQLVTSAEQRGATVVPVYSVLNPKGEDKGKAEGVPIPTDAWATASRTTLQDAAKDAAPKIANLLTGIQTTAQRADPNSLYNRVAKVQIPQVTGAPGDGNLSLTKQMRAHLTALGPVVQDTPDGADFTVQGNVRLVPIGGGQQRVEIQWSVKAANGDERGKVVQLNDIPAGALDHYWADVAVVVASEASGGVNDVIARQSGREPGQPVHGQVQGSLLEGAAPDTERKIQ
jgi:predicted aspartyl protease